MVRMYRQTFASWYDSISAQGNGHHGNVTIDGHTTAWESIYHAAIDLCQHSFDTGLYLIEPSRSHQCLINLLAITMSPGCSFFWGNLKNTDIRVLPVAENLYRVVDNNIDLDRYTNPERAYYGTLTSGTTENSKIAMGFLDQLPLIGAHYSNILYRTSLPVNDKQGYVCCCLPLEYSASFMMCLLPAWITCRNLIIFDPTNWQYVLEIMKNNRVSIVIAPSLLSTACASIKDICTSSNITFLTTAGPLSKTRVDTTLRKFPNARFEISYGSTETGIITFDQFNSASTSVGRPLLGKPTWVKQADKDGVGKIATSGLGNRQFYLGTDDEIENREGIVTDLDYGHFDQYGCLNLDGRVDKAIKINGKLIYTNMIESYLLRLEGIEDIKVIKSRGSHASEYLVAIAVGHITAEDLKVYCEGLPIAFRPKRFKVFKEKNEIYTQNGKMREINYE